MQNLLDIFEEHSAIHFSGRINILGAQKELLGVISILHGKLVNARRNGRNSLDSLVYFAFEDLESSCFQYVTEPEIITPEHCLFSLSVNEFKKRLSADFSEYQKIKKLRPPSDIKLLPTVGFLPSLKGIKPAEFDLLSVISEYSLVLDIYSFSPYCPLKTTKILVALRKLGAISVFKASNS